MKNVNYMIVFNGKCFDKTAGLARVTNFGSNFILASRILIHFLSLFIKLCSLVEPATLYETKATLKMSS